MKVISVLVIFLSSIGTAHASGTLMSEGQYQVTAKVTVTGTNMPSTTRSNTAKHCWKKQDVQDPKLIAKSMSEQGCLLSDFKSQGNKHSWSFKCSAGGMKTSGTGTATYEKERFFGVLQTTSSPGMGMTIQSRTDYSGKRIGDCK